MLRCNIGGGKGFFCALLHGIEIRVDKVATRESCDVGKENSVRTILELVSGETASLAALFLCGTRNDKRRMKFHSAKRVLESAWVLGKILRKCSACNRT